MASLKKQAEDLGIDVDGRWSDETLREKIKEARVERDANHEPAKSADTANRDGMETEEQNLNRVQGDGETNRVDETKNTDAGPGNPEYRTADPKSLQTNVPDGVQTEETPKMVHSTVSAAGPREITNNDIPDQSKRSAMVVLAERYGIMVDPNWDDQRIADELTMALDGRADLQVKGAVPATAGVTDEPRVKVKLKRDIWDDDGKRVRAKDRDGTVSVPRTIAQRLIREGKAERTDPLPGGED